MLVLLLLALGLEGAAAVGTAVESRPYISDDAVGDEEADVIHAYPGRSLAADCVVDLETTGGQLPLHGVG